MTARAASAVPIPASRPRRVSGGPRGAQVVPRGAVAAPGIPRPRVRAQPSPGRVRARPRPQPRAGESLLVRLLGVSDHRLLDRLIRGRLWIGVLAFALIGIVAMQLAVLSLNRATGQALDRVAQLQRENPALIVANSTAAAGESIEPQAASRGMVMAPIGAVRFLPSSSDDFARAARTLRASAAPVASQLTSQQSEGAQNPSQPGESEASPATSVAQTPSPSPATASETTGEKSSSTSVQTAEAGAQGQTSAQPASPTSSTTTGQGSGYPSTQATTVGSQGGTQAGP